MSGDYRRPVKSVGLDWAALAPTCRTCGRPDSSVNVETRECSTCGTPPAPAKPAKARPPKRGRRRATERPVSARARKPRAIRPTRDPDAPRAPRPDKIQFDVDALAAAYATGKTLRELADQHQVSAPTIARALDEAGVVRRKQRVNYSPELLESVRALYVNQQLDQASVAARLGITTKVVQTAMARGGIQPRESAAARSARGIGHPIKITPEIAGDILTRYTAGESAPRIARDHGLSAAAVYHLLTKHEIPRHGRRTPGLGRDGSIGLKARIRDLGVTAQEINRWAVAVGLVSSRPGLPSAATVDAWEAAHREDLAS